MKRLAALGECMIELRHAGANDLVQSFSGDTLNTAIYLSRLLGADDARVDYVTALGDDPYSERMIAAWRAEGLGTNLVARLPGRLPGLYIIRTDSEGERSFYYWRGESAAYDLCRAPEWETIAGRLMNYDLVYLSGISVAILDADGRRKVLDLLDRVRSRGGKVAFDSNYRPILWRTVDEARQALADTTARAEIALPSFADEARLFGDPSVEATADRLHAQGVSEVVITCGTAPTLVSHAGVRVHVPVDAIASPVDTTAAGDAFSAAYLRARLAGHEPEEAARQGHALARIVIQHPGAIVAAELTAGMSAAKASRQPPE